MKHAEQTTRLGLRASTRLAAGLGGSLLAHLALVSWWVLPQERSTPSTPVELPREAVVVETLGLVSDRQVEEQRAGYPVERRSVARLQAVSKSAPQPSSHSTGAPSKATRVDRELSTPRPEPTSEPLPDQATWGERQGTLPDSPSSSATSAQSAPGEGRADLDQVQRTLRASNPGDEQAMRAYVGELRRAIQSRLVYPREARAASFVGVPVIRFTVSVGGDILGSVTVVRSSGHALLDDNAVKAARESAPLPPPPHQVTVSIAVAFVRDP